MSSLEERRRVVQEIVDRAQRQSKPVIHREREPRARERRVSARVVPRRRDAPLLVQEDSMRELMCVRLAKYRAK